MSLAPGYGSSPNSPRQILSPSLSAAGNDYVGPTLSQAITNRPRHATGSQQKHATPTEQILVANRLNALVGPTDDRFEATGAPGGPSAGEGVALEADLAVIIARRGSRATDIRETVSILEQFGSPPRWALLVSSRRVRTWTDTTA